MDRYAPGVYKIECPGGVPGYDLFIDNKRIFVGATEKFTVYVNNSMYHASGKIFATYVSDNIDNISGAVAS